MRKIVFKAFALAALIGGFIQAKAEDTMKVLTVDETSIDNTISSITMITFGADAMTIVTASGEVVIPYAEVNAITFDLGTSGLQTLATDREMKVTYADSRLNISGADAPVDVAIFSINGTTVMADAACTATSIDVSRLSPGIYIAKINKAVVKFIKN